MLGTMGLLVVMSAVVWVVVSGVVLSSAVVVQEVAVDAATTAEVPHAMAAASLTRQA